jgi:hypothetical protein
MSCLSSANVLGGIGSLREQLKEKGSPRRCCAIVSSGSVRRVIKRTSGSKLGRHKVANCHCPNEIFSNVFVTSRRVKREFSAHNTEQAFAIWIADSTIQRKRDKGVTS